MNKITITLEPEEYTLLAYAIPVAVGCLSASRKESSNEKSYRLDELYDRIEKQASPQMKEITL